MEHWLKPSLRSITRKAGISAKLRTCEFQLPNVESLELCCS